MKVLMLTADYPPDAWSGVGVAVRHRAEALCRIGVEVDVLVSRDLAPVEASDPTPGKPKVVPLPRSHFPVDPASYDVIHVHSLRLASLALELRRRFRRHLVATVHGMPRLELESSERARHWADVQKRLLLGCDRVLFLSRAEARAGTRWLPEIATRARVVPHGLPVPADPRWDRDPEGPVVFAGRFTASKGIERIGELAEKSRGPWVAAGGRADRTGKRVRRRLAANERCDLPGWLPRPELEFLLRTARLVVAPSRYEPFGLLALEAMALGTPVLTSDVGGFRDTVRQTSGGRRCRTDDTAAWRTRLGSLLEGGEAAELGRRGPAWVAERFDPERRAAQLLHLGYGASRPPVSGAGP